MKPVQMIAEFFILGDDMDLHDHVKMFSTTKYGDAPRMGNDIMYLHTYLESCFQDMLEDGFVFSLAITDVSEWDYGTMGGTALIRIPEGDYPVEWIITKSNLQNKEAL